RREHWWHQRPRLQQRTRPYLDQAFRRRLIFRTQASPGRSAATRSCLFGPMRPKGLHLPHGLEPGLLALSASANRYLRGRLGLVALVCGLALRACALSSIAPQSRRLPTQLGWTTPNLPASRSRQRPQGSPPENQSADAVNFSIVHDRQAL